MPWRAVLTGERGQRVGEIDYSNHFICDRALEIATNATMKLLTSRELAAHLGGGVSSEGAAKLVQGLGVRPFFLGVGRGRGNRWDLHEVEEALRKSRDAARAGLHRCSRGHSLAGKSIAQLKKELTAAR